MGTLPPTFNEITKRTMEKAEKICGECKHFCTNECRFVAEQTYESTAYYCYEPKIYEIKLSSSSFDELDR